MTAEVVILNGCAPTPLASYLKALAVLRLISSPDNHACGKAADAHARGWWANERFHLRTTLSRDDLLRFFLRDYAPSPITAPWNGRAGFLEGDAGASKRAGAVLMRDIDSSNCRRLELMRNTVRALRKNRHLVKCNTLRAQSKALKKELNKLTGNEKKLKQDELRRIEKQEKRSKSLLLQVLRSETDSHHLRYVDACYVLSTDDVTSPLLGSGGNDGSRDFGVNFAGGLADLIDFKSGCPTDRAEPELESALFDVARRIEGRDYMGQFSPGHGGPNATTGYEGANALNPWDVVLAMEGTLVFAGALTRRWGATGGGSRAAFPFTFDPTAAGAGGLSSADPNRPRGEVWTPIWAKPATSSEVAAVFREGRLTIGQRTARTGLDAARSIAQIGSSRGISGFERYSFIEPDSKVPHQATPLGRFKVPDRPQRDIARDFDTGNWLERARKLAGDKRRAPARARQAMRRVEDALFQITTASRRREGTQHALMALGSLVAWLATNPKAREELAPPPPLSSDWIGEADDGSAEFRVAAALAGLGLSIARHPGEGDPAQVDDESAPVPPSAGKSSGASESTVAPPMIAHFAPLDEKRSFDRNGRGLSVRRSWSGGDASPTVVWGVGQLVPNLFAVLERRLVEAATRGLVDKPLASAVVARLADVSVFLSGDFDDARCAALLAGLVWVRPSRPAYMHASASPVPFAYSALKPVFTPDAALRGLGALPSTTRMPIPPEILAHLRTGGDSLDGRATSQAVRIALARARASGLPTPFDALRSGSRMSAVEDGRMGAGVPANRLAAALLIPVGIGASAALIKRAYPGALPEDDDPTTEDTNAA